MKRGVWVAALALGLGGGVAGVVGQEAKWRSAVRPPAPTAARGASPVSPGAVLGRPVPITRGASAEPRPFPEAYRHDPPGQRPVYGGIEPIATVPPPGSVIAASAPAPVAPPPSREEPQELPPPVGDLFATDRFGAAPVKPAGPALPRGMELEKTGSWVSTFPPEPAMKPQGEHAFEELPATKWYLRGEYLLWWLKNDKAPPLVTTTTLSGAALNPITASIAALGAPGTVVLSDGDLNRDPYSGGRFAAGFYFDDCGEKAVEVSGFFLGPKAAGFTGDSFAIPVIARPFFQANPPGGDSVEFVAFPGQSTGRVVVDAPSRLWGLEPNFLCKVCCGCDFRVDVLAGFRYTDLAESLSVTENVTFDSNARQLNAPDRLSSLAGATVFVKDRFACNNQFSGGQLGVEGRWQNERFTVDARAKVALGVTQQQLEVDGETRISGGDPSKFVPRPGRGGLLALQSNIGNFSRSEFSVLPEATLTAGYYVTDRLRATVGYNVLYWSNVIRPGGQIDPAIDVNLVPSFTDPTGPNGVGDLPPAVPPRPAQIFKSTDFWAHGINFGLEYRY